MTMLVTASISLHYLHMLQLSSYQWVFYKRWMRESGVKTWIRSAMPLTAAIAVSLIAHFNVLHVNIAMPVISFLFLLAILSCYSQKQQKKPLRFTARALRIQLLWIFLVGAIVVALLILLPSIVEHLQPAFAAIIIMLSIIGIQISNILLKPVQAMINNGYIRDAKKILAERNDMTLIAITGSYGKTSLKHMLHAFLSIEYNTLMTPGSYNTPMGVVRTIREELNPTHEYFVVEMGARRMGDIQELCDIVHPHHGVLTAIGPAHLETMGSIENTAKTKFELPRSLAAGSFSFLNADDDNIKQQNLAGLTPIWYGFDECADYRISDFTSSKDGSTFIVNAPNGESQQVSTPLIGRHNVSNIVGAMAVAHKFGVSLGSMARATLSLKQVAHRLELKKQADVTIIDDAFNSNPVGAAAALETLSMMEGCKILITPGMIELGDEQDERNKTLGKQAAAVCDYVILVGEKQTEAVYAGLAEAEYDMNNVWVVNNVYAAFEKMRAISAKEEKIVLLENDLPDNY